MVNYGWISNFKVYIEVSRLKYYNLRFKNFQKLNIQLKKDPLNPRKNKKNVQGCLKSKFYKNI